MIVATVFLLPLTLSAQKPPAPEPVRIGVFVMRLSDLNPATQSFSADFWVWTISSATSPFHPIQTLRVQNAKKFVASDPKEEDRGNVRWGYREFNATIVYDWDMSGFPFDRHKLEIAIGETDRDTRQLIYVPDGLDSGVAPGIRLSDWRLERSTLSTGIYPYPSRFGDPSVATPLTRWAEAHLTTEIRRKDRWPSFFKLTFTAYVAFAMMLLSFFMERAAFSSRVSLLVGSLFATVVSTRTSAVVLGQTPKFTLVEQIHLIVIFYILLSACVALMTYYVAETKPQTARQANRAAAILAVLTFVIWNLLLVAEAVRTTF
jgi:hypothetical protein